MTVKNTGDTAGCDVVQLYIRDDYSDVVRPVRELKGFRRVELAPGKEQEVTFYITEEDLRYYRLDGTFGSELERLPYLSVTAARRKTVRYLQLK